MNYRQAKKYIQQQRTLLFITGITDRYARATAIMAKHHYSRENRINIKRLKVVYDIIWDSIDVRIVVARPLNHVTTQLTLERI